MRLIDADSLMPSYVVTSSTTNSICHLYVSMEDIYSAPIIDAVEVVRCKDCKHKYRTIFCGNIYYNCGKRAEHVEPDGYCDGGERE